MWGDPVAPTDKIFTVNGTQYDFRGYTFDDARTTGWSAVVLGDGTTVLKFYYNANTDTTFTVRHFLVTGARTIKGDAPWLVETKRGITDTLVATVNQAYGDGIWPVDGVDYDFRGYTFRPRSDGSYPLADGTSVQTSLDHAITGDGQWVFDLYYIAQSSRLQFDLGSADYDPADGATDASWYTRNPSGGKMVDSTITTPDDADVRRPGYELVGWYIDDSGANLKGTASVTKANELMASTNMDATGTNKAFIAAGGTYVMPQGGATLFAVWRAKPIDYRVVRYQIVGEGTSATQLETVTRTGYAGDFAHGTFDPNDETVPVGYHLLGTDPDDPTSVTVGTTVYQNEYAEDGVYEIFANPVAPTIVHVFVANTKTAYRVEHYLVNGANEIVPGTNVAGDPTPYVLSEELFAKTDSIVSAAGAVRSGIVGDPNYDVLFVGYEYEPSYKHPTDTTAFEVLSGRVASDGSLVLRLYYYALPQHLSFDLGTVDENGNGTPDAYWFIDEPNLNPRSGAKVNLPKTGEALRPGYRLVGWVEAASDADGHAISDLTGTPSRNWYASNLSNPLFHIAGSQFSMPNVPTTLYAVWQANDNTTYTVEVHVVQGDGQTELYSSRNDYIGVTGDTVVFGDNEVTPANPYESWGTTAAERKQLTSYAINNVYGYTFSPSLTGALGTGIISADDDGNGNLVLKVWYTATPDQTTFFVERYYVDIDQTTKAYKKPVLQGTDTVYGTAGEYVKVDASAADVLAWIASHTTGGTQADPRLYNNNTDITGYDYQSLFNSTIGGITYATSFGGRVVGHANNASMTDGALVLQLFYTAHYYTLRLDPTADGTIDAGKDPSGDYAYGWTFTLPGRSDTHKTGYQLIGWTAADGTPYNLDANFNGTVQTMPQHDLVLTAEWEAQPVEYKVLHFKVNHDGTLVLVTTDTYSKKAESVATVGDHGNVVDVETYVGIDGVVNTAHYSGDQTGWIGYAHITNGSGTYNGTNYASLERATVLADGSTELYVFYAAQKVYYTVNRYKIDGNGQRILLSTHEVEGYVDNYVYADGYTHGANPADAGASAGDGKDQEYQFFDHINDAKGYTYLEEGATQAGYYAANAAAWKTTAHGTIVGDQTAGKKLVLDLYFEANENTLTLNLASDAQKGAFDATAIAAAGWTVSADGRSISRTYRTEQTTVALPADLFGAAHDGNTRRHDNANANPYRAGYELIGWSTSDAGAGAIGFDSQAKSLALTSGIGSGYYTASLDSSNFSDEPNGIFSMLLYTPDGATLLMPATDLQLWAIWNADSNTPFTVTRVKVDGNDVETQLSEVMQYGVTDTTVFVDGIYVDANETRLTGEYMYFNDDTAVTGYTYRRSFDDSIKNSAGRNVAHHDSVYTANLDGDGTQSFVLYYQANLNTITFHVMGDELIASKTAAGKPVDALWTGNPEKDTYNTRTLTYFTEETTSALYNDLVRAGYDFIGWSTDKAGANSLGTASRNIARDGADPINGYANTYYAASLAGTDLTDGTARYFTGTGRTMVMAAADVDLFAVWYARNDTAYQVEHWRVDGTGKLKGVVIENLTGITDDVMVAVDRLGDTKKMDTYDLAGKDYNVDDDFIGYTVIGDNETITYASSALENRTSNLRSETLVATANGASGVILHLFYTPDPLTVTFDLGENLGEMVVGGTTYRGEYVLRDVKAEANVNMSPYQFPNVTRTGYTFIGWTRYDELAGVLSSTAKGTAAANAANDALMNSKLESSSRIVMGVTDLVLHAVWMPDMHYVVLHEGGNAVTPDVIRGTDYTPTYRVYTDDAIVLPGSGVIQTGNIVDGNNIARPGYLLTGWYYRQTIEAGSYGTVDVGESEGSASIAASSRAEIDEVVDPVDGKHFTKDNGSTALNLYTVATGAPTSIHLYAVWRASNQTIYNVIYYKVDGNNELTTWLTITNATGITGDTVRAVDPHADGDPNSTNYSGAYNNQLKNTDWRGYAADYTNPVGYDTDSRSAFTPSFSPMSVGPLHALNGAGMHLFSAGGTLMAVGPGGTAYTITSDPEQKLEPTGTVLTLVMAAEKLPLTFVLGGGSWTDEDGKPTSTQPAKYDEYADPGLRAGIVSVVLPKEAEVIRPGYTFKGWTVAGYNSPYGDTSLAATLTGLNSRNMAAWIMANGGIDVDGVYIYNSPVKPSGATEYFVMPNHPVTLYAIWEANVDTTYQVVRYIITGDGKREVYDTIDVHYGVTDETAYADYDDSSLVDYANLDNLAITGYDYVPAGTNVTYIDRDDNVVTWRDADGNPVTSFTRGPILGHGDWSTWTKDADGVYIVPEGEQLTTFYLYYKPKSLTLTIDLGDGAWLPTANETRKNAFPSFPNAHTGSHEYRTGAVVTLPIDVRYEGLVSIGSDSQGRPYSLQGYAWDDGSTISYTDQYGNPQTKTAAELIRLAGGMHGLDNFDYRDALASAHLFMGANEFGSDYRMSTDSITLYAVWALSVQPLTFIPEGWADINGVDDPRIADKLKLTTDPGTGDTIEAPDSEAVKNGAWSKYDATTGDIVYDEKTGLAKPGTVAPTQFYDGKQMNIGQVINMPSRDMVVRVGYTLIGWSTDPFATLPDAGLDYRVLTPNADGTYTTTTWVMLADPTTLYAVWAADKITIIYDVNGGNEDSKPEPTESYVDTVIPLTEDVPTRIGATFKGWIYYSSASNLDFTSGQDYKTLAPWSATLGNDGAGDFSETENPNVLFALWEDVLYTITYVFNNGIEDYEKKFKYDELFAFLQPEDIGEHVLGKKVTKWGSSNNGRGTQYTADTLIADMFAAGKDSMKVYAAFGNKNYDVTYDVGTYDVNVLDKTGRTWGNSGLSPTVNIRGYEFKGWSTGKNGRGGITITNQTKISEILGTNDEERLIENGNPIVLYLVMSAKSYTVQYVTGFEGTSYETSRRVGATGTKSFTWTKTGISTSLTFMEDGVKYTAKWYTEGGDEITNKSTVSQIATTDDSTVNVKVYARYFDRDGNEYVVTPSPMSLMSAPGARNLRMVAPMNISSDQPSAAAGAIANATSLELGTEDAATNAIQAPVMPRPDSVIANGTTDGFSGEALSTANNALVETGSEAVAAAVAIGMLG